MSFESVYKATVRPFRQRLWLTAAMAAGVSVSAVALLGLSGWFLTAAAIAGAAGPVAAQAFNYVLPSAFIRLFAVARTVLRYGERYLGHSAALRAMAILRPGLFERLAAARPSESLAISRGEASSRFLQDVGALEARRIDVREVVRDDLELIPKRLLSRQRDICRIIHGLFPRFCAE